jgi:hypothetical protein
MVLQDIIDSKEMCFIKILIPVWFASFDGEKLEVLTNLKRITFFLQLFYREFKPNRNVIG